MSKKDYKEIAAVFQDCIKRYPDAKAAYLWLAEHLAVILKMDNRRFSYERFLQAITG